MVDMDLEQRFQKAVSLVQTSSSSADDSSMGSTQPSNEEKLRFYGLFKQATVGPADLAKKPSWYDVVARAKFDAWNSYRNLSKDEAKEEYIDEVVRYLKRFPERPKAMEVVESLVNSKISPEEGMIFK
jgi:acyl-CoA-binding protein